MSPSVAGLFGMSATAAVIGLWAWLMVTLRGALADMRLRRRRREDEHDRGIRAYRSAQPRPVLVRIVNGRPVMPPRLPVPRSPWLWPDQPSRAMTWSGAAR